MLNREFPKGEICEPSDFQIQHKWESATVMMNSPHFHDYFEIYYMLDGEKKYFIGNRLYLLHKGDMVIFPPYELHKNVGMANGRFEGILVYFSRDFLFDQEQILHAIIEDLMRPSNYSYRFEKNEQKSVEYIFEKMAYEYKNKQPGRRLYLKTLLSQLLIFLYRKSISEGESSFRHLSSLHQKGSEIAQYIEKHYTEQLSLSDISCHFAISTYYLCRIFKETSGFSINEYLNTIRLREARRLLRETDEPIIRVSELSGFGSVSNFGRIFKNYYGVSPLQFRKYL